MKSRKLIALAAAILLATGAGWITYVYQGVGTDMTEAATAFLGTLEGEKLKQATMEYAAADRLDWHFIPKDHRKGLQIKHMDEAQRKQAHRLLESGLSELGYAKATTVMQLESILHELEKDRQGGNIRDAERYYFTVFGKPAETGEWGWSVEGHHLSLNFAVQDGRVASVTPAFYGANPATVMHDHGVGPKKGTRVLRAEEDLAFQLVNALSDAQRDVAMIAEKAPRELREAGQRQPVASEPEGLAVAKMDAEQKKTLRALLKAYTDNMPKEVGDARTAAIEAAGFDTVHFAWAGATKPGVGHYYRVQGPTFLAEFINVQPDPEGNPANHIHLVWRNLDGDFGQSRD